jgi:hypothetical protein
MAMKLFLPVSFTPASTGGKRPRERNRICRNNLRLRDIVRAYLHASFEKAGQLWKEEEKRMWKRTSMSSSTSRDEESVNGDVFIATENSDR